MRVIAELRQPTAKHRPPMLVLIVHGAPHRRAAQRSRGKLAMMQQYRDEIRKACVAANIVTPIDTTVDLWLEFIDPTSPDKDNLLVAIYQAMDGKTLRGPGIFTDDGIIGTIRNLSTIYTVP